MPVRLDPSGASCPAFGEARFRVPKQPIPVSLVLEGGSTLDGCLHVLPEAGVHEGRERVVDVLCAAEQFVPFTQAADGRLVNKKRIVLARVHDPEDAGWDEQADSAAHIEVEIVLADAPARTATLVGVLHIAMPPGRTRLLDYLNDAGRFLALCTPEGVLLVNRDRIVELRQR